MTSTPLLLLDRATFRLGDRLVFPETSWVYRRDEQWAVLGPNGSGKSLFADCLRGQLPLVAGELRYHFRARADQSPEELIGHVAFEERRRALHGEVVQSRWNSLEEEGALVVREYLSYERVLEINPFEVRGDDRLARAAHARRLRHAANLLDIGSLWDRTLLSLSNGERQRVELARILSRRLRLLILDEPFAGLDRAHREHFRSALERLLSSPFRVLFVSSRGEDLPSGITHVMELEDCRILRMAGRLARPPQERGASNSTSERSGHRKRGAKPLHRTKARGSVEGPAVVVLRNVTVRYGRKMILDNLSWTIRQGQHWALLGPNGSGKSTVLSLIVGDHPQAYMNEVIVFAHRRGCGESIWDIKRRIGWVSPELQTYFSQELTCLEVAVSGFFDSNGLFESPTSRQCNAALRWLERFGLRQFASRPMAELSPGVQPLALLARALVKRPELLLLDEPCQGLDTEHCRLLLSILSKEISEGTATIVYVTHREEEIPCAITRVLRLRTPAPSDQRRVARMVSPK